MIDGDGRDAAPIIDPGREQRGKVIAEIRRRLQVDVVGKDQPRHRDRPQELLRRARVGAVHRGAELRQEVLHDHLLHVPVLAVRVGDRDERIDAFLACLADADEDARRERHARLAGGGERREAARGGLVGRAVVGSAGLAEARRQRLDHHSLRRADRAQPLQLGAGERARVRVGEQAGLVEDELGRGDEIVHRARVAVRGEPLRRLRVPGLGRLAEREQRFVAAELGTPTGNLEDRLRREERAYRGARAAWRTCSSRTGRDTAS